MTLILLGVLVLAVGSGIIIYSYQIIRAIALFFFKNYINRHLLLRRLNPAYRVALEQYSTYYQNLNEENKKIFRRRTQKFIDMKEFVPRGSLHVVSGEMKALIASCAVQITFGYPSVYFQHFWRILVYPDNYYSDITNKFHQGETNTSGFIILSWVNFVKGFQDPSNGRNLGLHEMAHALKFENAVQNDEYDFLDWPALKEFNQVSVTYIEKISNGENTFFREYAASNREEFFAVIVENFFERPAEFKNRYPDLYSITARILNQDVALGIYQLG